MSAQNTAWSKKKIKGQEGKGLRTPHDGAEVTGLGLLDGAEVTGLRAHDGAEVSWLGHCDCFWGKCEIRKFGNEKLKLELNETL